MDIIEIKTAGMLASSLPINSTPIDASGAQAPEFMDLQTPGDILGLPDFVFE